jgi:hypothetical protein
MKPRTVYEKAVQDFTETAQQLARLNQHFRQASFSEFEMLMGLDDEVLKRYGLPKADGQAGAPRSVSNRRARSAEMTASPKTTRLRPGDRCRGKLMVRKFVWDPGHWRFRAEEARTVADQMTHEGARTIMRRIAMDYDRLAKLAEVQLADQERGANGD